MTLQDNGDGTYTDLDTGDLTDVYGNIIDAVPNSGLLDYANESGLTSSGQVDTSVGAAPTRRDVAGNSFLTGADEFFTSIESGLTNLYTPLVAAGVVVTPAQQAAQQAAQTAAQSTADSVAEENSQKKVLTYGLLLLAALFLLRSAQK